jgi:prepilin-type N-terminal cleavage/methylation domain-containing protein
MNNSLRHTRGLDRKTMQQAQGFTLLEIVFVLGMIAIIVSWVTLTVTTVETEHKLRRAAGSIESLVKRGRSIAVMQQRPYQVTITLDSVSMAPQYMRTDIEDDYDDYDDDEEGASREDFENITASENIDPEVTYEIRRWRSDLWQEIDKDHQVVLTLDPAGLVEPISVRCSVGKSWLIQELHPLTGGVRDEEMSIEDE